METKRAGWLVTLLGIAVGLVLLGGHEREASSGVSPRASTEGTAQNSDPPPDPGLESPSTPVTREPIPAEPAQPTRLAVLEIACCSAPGKEGTPVAGVELVAGVLCVGKERPTEELPLARGESDGAGRVRFELAVPVEAPSEATRLFARVVEEGFQERVFTRTLERAVSGVERLEVVVARGGTARGLVVSAAGEPVPGADLVLLEEEPRGSGRLAHRMSSRARSDGSFELHVPRSALFQVEARASGLGSGALRDLELDVAHLPQDLRVTIDGAGVLDGVLADSQGEPIKETSLRAVPADLGKTPSYEERYARELEGGLCSDVARTDLAGRFRFTGLRLGDYVLTQGEGTFERPIGGPFPTGEEAQAFVSAPRLEIRVLEPDGSPVLLAKREERGEAFLVDERLRCFLDPPRTAEERLAQDSGFSRARVLSDETVVFSLEAERAYAAGFFSSSAPLQVVQFQTTERACLVRREIRLRPPAEPGELRLTILEPGGRPFGPIEENQVFVREAESGREVVACKQGFKRWGNMGSSYGCSLAPGRYLVRVEAEPFEGCMRGPGEPRVAKFSPAERDVEILAGRVTEAEIELGGSGRLELTVTGWTDAPRPLVKFRESGLAWDDWMEEIRSRAQGLRVHLTDAGDGRDLPTGFFVGLPWSLTIIGGPSVLDDVLDSYELPWILPGLPHRSSSPIPPGEYVVRVELPDGQELEGRVSIEHGKTTSLVLAR